MVLRDHSMEDKISATNAARRDTGNLRDSKRVARQPFVQKYRRREYEEDKGIRKLSFDIKKRHPTPEVKASIENEFS